MQATPMLRRNSSSELAKQRWSQRYAFDLAEETWTELFDQYRAVDILVAISETKGTHNPTPERIFASFTYWLNRLAKERLARVSWPPSDVKQL